MEMTDDIATRLRQKYQGQLPICAEAADEIERLRTELEELQIDRDSWFNAYRLLCDLKAVRGE